MDGPTVALRIGETFGGMMTLAKEVCRDKAGHGVHGERLAGRGTGCPQRRSTCCEPRVRASQGLVTSRRVDSAEQEF